MKMDRTEEEFDQQIIKIIQHRPELVQRAGFPIQDCSIKVCDAQRHESAYSGPNHSGALGAENFVRRINKSIAGNP